MEHLVALLILITVIFLANFYIRSLKTIKREKLLEKEVIVSKEFYEASIEIYRLLNCSNSIKEQRNNLPNALYRLGKEINDQPTAELKIQKELY